MKKYIGIGMILVIMGMIGYYGSKRYNETIQNKDYGDLEKAATSYMDNEFSTFAANWQIEGNEGLFVKNIEIENTKQIANEIQKTLGSCEIAKGSTCEAGSKYDEKAYSISANNYNMVSCGFSLKCEKNDATGISVLFLENGAIKLFSFTLDIKD